MTEPAAIMCPAHPDKLAGWKCHGDCKAYLCAKCTAQLVKLFSCCHCGSPAHRLSVPRRSKGFGHWLGVALAQPVKLLPVFALFALLLGGVAFVAASGGTPEIAHLANLARAALVVIFVMIVVDAAAHGASDNGTPLRIARALLAISFVLAPGIIYVLLVGVPGAGAQRDVALWLFAGLVIIYVPIALAVAVTEAPLGSLLNPFVMFEVVWRLGRTYVATLVIVGALAAATFALATAGTASIKASIHAPIVGDAAAALPWLWLLAAVAGMVGLLTYVHGDRFGWGATADYVEPIYPKMVAEGVRKLVDRTQQDGDDDDAQAKVEPAERAEAAKLDEALRSENVARALKLYEARANWSPASVDDRKLVALARGATRAKRLDLAERMLDEACARKGRAAGQAMLALAQLHGESLGNAARAKQIYQAIVHQFAGSDVAKIAAKKLDA